MPTEPNAAPDAKVIADNVRAALSEDVGSGDISAQLIAADANAAATVITREDAVLCGTAWATAVFFQVDPEISINWLAKDGDRIAADQKLLQLSGPARGLLTGERAALNFLQLLSGTATSCQRYADLVADTKVRLLDTRKT
ncbi:MAG: nicotinate-nucleotide diphosphorylase (carboxylating), partial [Halieaceae bacterium]